MFAASAFFSITPHSLASQILYGGVGNSATSPGAVVIIDQSTGAGTVLGTPNNAGGITGFAFNSLGQLFATVSPPGGSAFLEQIDPVTFTEIGSPVSLSADPNIGDLTFQPNTDILFGVSNNRSSAPGTIYTINTTTGVETLIGNPASGTGGGLAFAPDGTLYYANFTLFTLDPTNASVITQVALTPSLVIDGLGIRADGVLFANVGQGNDSIYTIDPATGASTLVGGIGGGNRVSDLDFLTTPEPGTNALMALGGLALLAGRWLTIRLQGRLGTLWDNSRQP